MPDMEFHLAGAVRAATATAPVNVFFHGPLTQLELGRLYSHVDVGIGNLALETIGRLRPSPLKVREYVRAGLPCVIAHEDPDLPPDPSVLRLPFGFVPTPELANSLRRFVVANLGSTCSGAVAESVSLSSKEAVRAQLLRCVATTGSAR